MKEKWFRAIKDGEKHCEIRAATMHWMSRIDGATHCSFSLGFLAEACLNCLSLFGWSFKTDLEHYSERNNHIQLLIPVPGYLIVLIYVRHQTHLIKPYFVSCKVRDCNKYWQYRFHLALHLIQAIPSRTLSWRKSSKRSSSLLQQLRIMACRLRKWQICSKGILNWSLCISDDF